MTQITEQRLRWTVRKATEADQGPRKGQTTARRVWPWLAVTQRTDGSWVGMAFRTHAQALWWAFTPSKDEAYVRLTR